MRTLGLALLMVASLAAQSSSPVTLRSMTPADVLAIKGANGVRISPEGKWVLYELASSDPKDNRARNEIWLASAAGQTAPFKPRRFTSGRQDRSPQWSPDGQWVAFLGTRGDAAEAGAAGGAEGTGGAAARQQIFLMPAFGGEADALTDAKSGVTSFAWSPDSARIAFVATVPLTDAQEKDQKDRIDARVIDADYRYSHLWVIDAESKKATEIVKNNAVLADPQWSPDGRRLAFVSRPTPRADDGGLSDVYITNADGTGSPRKLLENEGPDDTPRWSPDGRSIALTSRDAQHGRLGIAHLIVIPAEGGKPRDLSPDPDAEPTDLVWSADGSALYFRAAHHTTAQIYRAAVSGGTPEALTRDEATITSFSVSHDGTRMAFSRSDLQHAPDVYVSSLPKVSIERVTDHSPSLRDLALGRSEVIHWSGKDGMALEGLLIYPVGYRGGNRVPLVAAIHGGPSGVWAQAFPRTVNNYTHVWAGKGWAVFLPNIRGSSAYGEKFQVANVRDWGGMDYWDIQTGLDELVKRGIADPDRMVQTGWSYGGYMTAWTLTQTARFKAVVVGAGLTDMFSMYPTNDLHRVLDGYFGDTPWNDLESYRRASAMTYITQAKTPTLILHGGADVRVPVSQGQELYVGLQKNNVPVQMVVYPREGHGFSEPRHILDKMKRETEWIEKYLGSATSTTP
jgi:dipeptidyl aminopeptidase/acylaminoacyl peptidase